jgi:alanyl-tRNA synthetase
LKTSQLRRKFLDFFRSKGHKIFPSDTLVPDDPTVLFTSAGMNQFKPYFLGERKELKRAASSQKCLRTVDCEKVGKTPYHHTFFEMLGNFSFGDYFKEEAIIFAWEFLTKDLNMKYNDLWVSVYKDDEEAYRVWKSNIGIAKSRIIKLGDDKNFWPANAPLLGPNGPCGPCSEIFFDKGESIGCGRSNCNPDCECGRFVEVWNLVFTQFNRIDKNKLIPLPQKNIDTGMGLERMASVLQGKDSNFQIDILLPVVEFLRGILSVTTYYSPDTNLINAIVDHGRAVTFAIGDGVFPSNEERGYIVRKLIRTALWKGTLLGAKSPFLYRLPPLYGELMKDFYPEVYKKREDISHIIFAEEEKFLSTLQTGKNKLIKIIEECKREKRDVIEAEKLFYLYDTEGFPLELSKEIASDYNIKVDEDRFKCLFKKQQALSRKKSMFDESIFKEKEFALKEISEFVGYESNEIRCNILRLIEGSKDTGELKEGSGGYIVLDRTPFYPQGGGQSSDRGVIKAGRGEFLVEDVFKVQEAIVHKGRVVKGCISKEAVYACIDIKRRRAIARAHTATHLLQSALRMVLGTHVTQQGSLVDVDRLRFDFTHFKSLAAEEQRRVEDTVNEFILKGDKVEKRILTLEDAKEEGALAFFKDKYKDLVRVIAISNYSKELCGGTHLRFTSEVGLFVIVSESSISSGVRRIEAVVGEQAYRYFKNLKQDYKEMGNILKSKPGELKTSLRKLLNDFHIEKEKSSKLEKQLLALRVDDILKAKKEIKGVKFLAYNITEQDYPGLLYLWDIVKEKWKSAFVFFFSHYSKKNIFICATTDDFIERGLTSHKFVSLYKEKLSLKGGGRSDLVQGVITRKDNDFLRKLEESISEFLTSEV